MGYLKIVLKVVQCSLLAVFLAGCQSVSNNPSQPNEPGTQLTPTPPPTPQSTITANNVYENVNYGFSFQLLKDERVIECPNNRGSNDNIAVWVTTAPKILPEECGTEGPDSFVFADKKSQRVRPVDDYARQTEQDYTVNKTPVTINGAKGYKLTGTMLPNHAAPLPKKLDQIAVEKNETFYIFASSYLKRNFTIK